MTEWTAGPPPHSRSFEGDLFFASATSTSDGGPREMHEVRE